MPHPSRNGLRNRLLRRLPPSSFEALAPHLQPVQLARGLLLSRTNEVISDVYFVEDGIASVILSIDEGREIETGLFGLDGFGPVAVVLGVDRMPGRIVMQVAGSGFRVGASALTRIADTDVAARLLLMRYVHTLSLQVAYTALVNAVTGVEARLARWLLMCRDRLTGDDMPLTHEFLGVMLAVRRASMTVALHALEGQHMIQVRRGSVVIRDRRALESVADASYGRAEAEYERLIGGGK